MTLESSKDLDFTRCLKSFIVYPEGQLGLNLFEFLQIQRYENRKIHSIQDLTKSRMLVLGSSHCRL